MPAQRYWPALLLAAVAALLLANNHSVPLWNQDEAAYAGFGWRMNTSGDWLIPEFTWSEIHRKTPFHFWCIALAQRLFGYNEFATRLPASLFTWLTIASVWHFGRRLLDERTALLAAAMLATSLLVNAYGKISLTDGPLLFFETLCGFFLIFLLRSGEWRWAAYFWLAAAAALLVKGPPVLIFGGAFAFAMLLAHPRRWRVFRLHPWLGLPLALLPLFAWGWLAWQRDGGAFVTWLWEWYGPSRVDKPVLGQTGPPGYFLASFLLAFLAYLPFALAGILRGILAFAQARAAEHDMEKETLLLLGGWLLGGWLIYEAMSSKLPSYALAAHPAVALLAAQVARQWLAHEAGEGLMPFARWLLPALRVGALLGGLIWAALFAAAWVAPQAFGLGSLRWAVLLLCGPAGLLGVVAAYFVVKKRAALALQAALMCGFAFLGTAWAFSIPQATQAFDATKEAAQYLAGELPPGSPIIVANSTGKPPSLPFYLARHFGQEPERIYEQDSLYLRYRQAPRIGLILRPEQAAYFQAQDSTLRFQRIASGSVDRMEGVVYEILVKQ